MLPAGRRGGIRKKPTFPFMWESKFPDSQSPSKISRPVAVHELAHHRRVVGGVGVLVEVPVLDPAVEVVDRREVRRGVDVGARLVEDPAVDRADGP